MSPKKNGGTVMGEEAYNAAVMAMGYYGGLLQEIVKEFGWEKAIEMNAKLGLTMSVQMGEEIKKATSGAKPDIKVLESLNSQMMTGFGCTFKVSEKGNSVKYEVSRCPMYDGFKASGFSHEQIGKMCEAMALKEYEGIKSILPNVAGKVEFRTRPDGSCIEEFEIK